MAMCGVDAPPRGNARSCHRLTRRPYSRLPLPWFHASLDPINSTAILPTGGRLPVLPASQPPASPGHCYAGRLSRPPTFAGRSDTATFLLPFLPHYLASSPDRLCLPALRLLSACDTFVVDVSNTLLFLLVVARIVWIHRYTGCEHAHCRHCAGSEHSSSTFRQNVLPA